MRPYGLVYVNMVTFYKLFHFCNFICTQFPETVGTGAVGGIKLVLGVVGSTETKSPPQGTLPSFPGKIVALRSMMVPVLHFDV